MPRITPIGQAASWRAIASVVRSREDVAQRHVQRDVRPRPARRVQRTLSSGRQVEHHGEVVDAAQLGQQLGVAGIVVAGLPQRGLVQGRRGDAVNCARPEPAGRPDSRHRRPPGPLGACDRLRRSTSGLVANRCSKQRSSAGTRDRSSGESTSTTCGGLPSRAHRPAHDFLDGRCTTGRHELVQSGIRPSGDNHLRPDPGRIAHRDRQQRLCHEPTPSFDAEHRAAAHVFNGIQGDKLDRSTGHRVIRIFSYLAIFSLSLTCEQPWPKASAS